ncbi:hypothetical protein BDW62DRAFT_201184 [Aspergillus aurantiobrunneus]
MAGATKDLWTQVVDRLSQSQNTNDFKAIDWQSHGRADILRDVLALVRTRQQECLDRRWKLNHSGKTIVVREYLEKAALWVKRFVEVGDVCVQYDPAHASLPWGGIRFLLRVVISDIETMATTMESVEAVAAVITRYAIYERLYLGRASCVQGELEDAIKALYEDVLMYLLMARKYFMKTKLRRIMSSTFQPEERTQSLLQSISATDTCTAQLISIIQAEYDIQTRRVLNDLQRSLSTAATDITQQLQNALSRTEQAVVQRLPKIDELHSAMKESETQKLREWLCSTPYLDHHRTVCAQRLAGTCQWIESNPELIRWRDSTSSSILHVRGIPGCGKTTLVSYLIDYMTAYISSSYSSSRVCYFYCHENPAEPERSNPDEVLRCIVEQIAWLEPQRQYQTPLLRIYEEAKAISYGQNPRKLSMEDTIAVLLELVKRHPATIIVDALDECDPTRRYTLFTAFRKILQDAAYPVKVLLSSRDDGDILDQLAAAPNICIQPRHNAGDIIDFVRHAVAKAIDDRRLIRGMVPAALQRAIEETLTRDAQGMFRWASLQVDYLCNQQHIKLAEDVEAELGRLPSTLQESYASIYSTICMQARHSRDLANRTLAWLVCCQRSLPASDLIYAVSLSMPRIMGSHEVLDVCRNLVILDEEQHVFRLAHTSVREYLESIPEYSLPRSHSMVAQCCLDFLCHGVVWSSSSDRPSALRQYAALFWPLHMSLSENEPDSMDDLLCSKVSTFISQREESSPYLQWLEACEDCWPTAPWHLQKKLRSVLSCESTLVFLGCVFGIMDILKYVMACNTSLWNQSNQFGESPLQAAALNDQFLVVQKLLDWHPISSVTERDLNSAAQNKGAKATEILTHLLQSAEPEAVTIATLKCAALNRTNGEKLVEILLQWRWSKHFVEGKSPDGISAIQSIDKDVFRAAASNGEQGHAIIKTLWRWNGYRTVTTGMIVAAAMTEGHDRALLKHLWMEANGDQLVTGQRIVEAATSNPRGGRKTLQVIWDMIGNIVVSKRAIFNAINNVTDGLETIHFIWDKTGGFPLDEDILNATVRNFVHGEKFIQFYLSKDSHLHFSNEICWNAAQYGSKAIMETILSHKKAMVMDSDIFRAAAANRNCGCEMIEFLWHRSGGFNVDEALLVNAVGNTENGRGIVEMLRSLNHGPLLTSIITSEVFRAAAANEFSSHALVSLLLEDAGKCNTSIICPSVIEAAAAAGQERTLALLQQRFPEAVIENMDLIAKFCNAAKAGIESDIQHLLAAGVNPDLPNIHGATPLWQASARGHVAVVRALLETGRVDVHSQTETGRTPIFIASLHGWSAVVALLLEAGANPCTPDRYGETAILVARQTNQETVLGLLEDAVKLRTEGKVVLQRALEVGGAGQAGCE